MRRVVTIGVYGFTLDAFLDALRSVDARLVMDVRQRRGVRGSEYAWANAKRLEAALAEAGIEYEHHIELAPTTELRQAQYREDERRGIGKRNRRALAPAYRDGYLAQILDRVELGPIVESMPEDAASALMCVERDPEACHRSLIAARLEREFGVAISHIRP